MSSQLKISADTNEAKKSILDLSKSFQSMKGSKVSIFTKEDRVMIKGEMKKQLELMKIKIKENKSEIKKLFEEQKKQIQGSKEELEIRKKIIDAYKIQAKLATEVGTTNKGMTKVASGSGSGGISGSLMSIFSSLPKLLGGAALATVGFGVLKGIEGTNQYVGGVGSRTRLKGLGVKEDQFGSANDLARVGVTEQEMVQRRIEATSVLGRGGTSNKEEFQKAGFERAYGLEGGTMTGIAAQLRPQMGGRGATDAQMKLQASVMAAGIEDAVGPYLKSAVDLLTSINENGMSNTSEMTGVLAQLTKEGSRTPEQLGKNFSTVDAGIRNSTGPAAAFFQTAFAKSGIGGGTLGGTRFATESGGLMGLNEDELKKRGYNPELLKNMGKSGFFTGVGKRTQSVLNQFKQSAGMGKGQNIGGITDVNQMVGMNNLSNNVFGTKGSQGFDVLQMLEKVQSGGMSQNDFDKKLKNMQEGQDPVVHRLDDINKSLAGQTDVLNHINTNLLETLGKEGVQIRNQGVRVENEGIKGVTDVAGGINATGLVQGAGNLAVGASDALRGPIGDKLYDTLFGDNENQKVGDQVYKSDMASFSKKGGTRDFSQPRDFPSAKAIGDAVANSLKNTPPAINKNSINIKQYNSDGTMTDKTVK